MRAFRRLVVAFALVSMFCGIAALAADTIGRKDGAGNCRQPVHGRRHHCDPLCGPCEVVVCDGTGWCKYHCEPIDGCVP